MFELKSNANAKRNSNANREQTMQWLNVGITCHVNGEDKFVSLPLGIPLDSMEPKRYSGSNESYAEFVSAQNELIEAIKSLFQEIPQGTSKRLNSRQFTLELRHAEEASTTPVEKKLGLAFKLK